MSAIKGNRLNSGYDLSTGSISKILFDTIKVGIIKSNLISMFAGLSMALLVNDIPFYNEIGNILLALIGSALVIGSAGAFNNVYDRDIDVIMERTKSRPTVTGTVSLGSGLAIGIMMAIGGIAALYAAAPLSALFGFLGLFLYVVPYTMWTKRRTVYNTEVGSLSGAVPPLIGWTAISSDITHMGLAALFVLMLIWQMPHFYAIAIRRMEEYRAANIPMLPVVKGMRRTYRQTNFYLVLLLFSGLLFWSFSPFVAITSVVLSAGWLVLSLAGYRRMGTDGWAKSMFIFSLNHITILLLIVIGYSLIKPLMG
ncbi:heme o synthase [Paenibacillus methanolicus]|uniref:Protoheme IX farnesyltransferase n=1 Tax=Paenibacillus methanolicus TaxID=582686 RepID=A0A5S5CIX4_9BACL|nr:heme o synthase [Paenibacillus methanolicus]TYP79652.1 protoheme IX farnesyltransferase [Paenibacillus methanolicus]